MVRGFFLLAFFLFSFPAGLLNAQPLRQQGQLDFKLPDLENKEVSLSDFRGHPVILVFWTSECPICVRELGRINAIYPDLAKKGLVLLAINAGESRARAGRFAERRGLLYKVLLDSDLELVRSLDIFGVPTYVMVDKDGKIVFQDFYFPQQEYEELISK